MTRRCDGWHHLLAASLLVCLGLAPSGALAQRPAPPEDPATITAARELGIEGIKLADVGDCSAAVEKLRKSEALHHAPTTLGRLGECKIRLGHLVEGAELLERVVREQLPENPPAAFVAAQDRARRLLEETRPKIGRLRVIMVHPERKLATIRLDGEELGAQWDDVPRPVNPGEHRIVAHADGFEDHTITLHVQPGDVAEASIRLVPTAPAPAPAPPAAPAPLAPPPPEKNGKMSARDIATWGALGVGVLGLGVGAIFGFVALDTKEHLDEHCPNGACPPSSQFQIDRLSTEATISTAGFVVGALGVTGAAVLYFTKPSKDSRTHAALRVRPTGAALDVSF